MASCILRIPAFAPPDFAAPSRFEDVVMSSPSPASGSFLVPDSAAPTPLYPERFGLTTTTSEAAAHHQHHRPHQQQQHFQATAPSSSSFFSDVLESSGAGGLVASRSSLPLAPCKIEPESQAMMLRRGAFLCGRQQQQFVFPGTLDEPALLRAPAALSPSKRSFGSSEQQYQEYEQRRNKLHRMAAEFSATSGGREDTNAAAAAAGSPPPPTSSMLQQQQQQEPEHEVHIWTERERRKKMRSMFVTLHSMLPKVPSKADKSTIVDEAINYIKVLEHRMQQLQRKKAERVKVDSVGAPNSEKAAAEARIGPETQVVASQSTAEPRFQTVSSSNVVFNVCGSDAFLTICTGGRRPSSLSEIFSCVMETHKLEVKNVQITDSSESRRLLMMHVCTKDATRTTEDLKALLRDLTMHCA